MKTSNLTKQRMGVSPPTALPFKVRYRGRIERLSNHSTLGTHHGDVMFTLVVGGYGTYRRGGGSVRVGTGMVGLVFPEDDPGILFADTNDPYDHFGCRFSGSEAVRMARRISQRFGNRPFFDYPGWQTLADACQRLVGCKTSRDNDDCLSPADTMFAHILSLMEFDDARTEPYLDADRLIRYMREHLADPASLNALARYFGISKEHLCRIAKPALGTTILKKWVEMKLDWARVLLQDDSFAVKEVSRMVGYDNPLYFSNVFKKHVGISPSQYRTSVL